MQVTVKVFPQGTIVSTLEAQVQQLQQASKGCENLCQVHGMLEGRPCVILDELPQTSLAAELASIPGNNNNNSNKVQLPALLGAYDSNLSCPPLACMIFIPGTLRTCATTVQLHYFLGWNCALSTLTMSRNKHPVCWLTKAG